jgi:hypothetical protein
MRIGARQITSRSGAGCDPNTCGGLAVMDHMTGMMIGMGLIGAVVIIMLVLLAAALVKYLFFR